MKQTAPGHGTFIVQQSRLLYCYIVSYYYQYISANIDNLIITEIIILQWYDGETIHIFLLVGQQEYKIKQ